MICTIDFKLILLDFEKDFAIFTWMDRPTDGQKNGQTARIMEEWTNEELDMQ